MSQNAQRSVLKILYALIVGVFFLFAVVIGLLIWNDVKRDRHNDLIYSSRILKSYYELEFKQWELTLLSVGQRMLDIQGENYEQRRMDFAVNAASIYEQLLAFGFADTTGNILTFSGKITLENAPNLMEQDYARRSFIEAKTRSKITIGEAYFFRSLNDWIIPIRLAIRDNSGNLLAVNTSALQYSSVLKEIESFGFEKQYNVHFVNDAFNTTLIYYAESDSIYSDLIRADASIYASNEFLANKNQLQIFKAFNRIFGQELIATKIELEGLQHQVIISVPKSILWKDFKLAFVIILVSLIILIVLTTLLFIYFQHEQDNYLNKIEKERANLTALFESTNSLIGLFDKNKRLIHFNQSFAQYSKLTDDIDLQAGMDVISQMKNKPIAAMFSENLDKALTGEKFKATIPYPSMNGTIYFLLSYHPIVSNNEVIGLSMFVEDITELKQSQQILEKYSQTLEELVEERTEELSRKNQALQDAMENLTKAQNQLIQSEKMASLGLLSAGVGHEINNPLNFIKHGVISLDKEMELQFGDSKSLVAPYIDIIKEGVKRASGIVKSLSHFSRQGQSMNEVCDVHEILDNCLLILNNKLEYRITIDKNYCSQKVKIHGNAGKLHQAFLNILNNAEQSIKHEGKITISTQIEDHDVIVSIRDSGIGIEPENLNKISDPFFTTKPPGKGTGLGLFLTYSIIEEHKGKISVNSILNSGTEFLVYFKN